MKNLELKYGCQILVDQVSGLRMIAKGTDVVPMGQWNEDVMVGLKIFGFCPWGKTVLDAAPRMNLVIKLVYRLCWVLEPKKWFYRGYDLNGGELDSKKF